MAATPTPSTPSKALIFARRSASTAFLWAIVSAVFMSRWSWAFLGLIGVLTIIATVEYFRMLRAAKVSCFPRFGMGVAMAYCGALHWFFLHGIPAHPDLEAFAIFIVLAGSFSLQLRYPICSVQSLLAVAANVLGFIYIAVLFNFAARLLFIIPGGNEAVGIIGEPGAFLLLWLLAVTKFTDMGAYITGSMIGRHKMIPHVSPGKTWEGFGGALLFSQLAGIGLYFAFPAELAVFGHIGHVIALSFILALLAVVGDLAESIVKRALDAKDSGSMLPGIGGSLDLIDSICFTAPAMYFYLEWLLIPNT